MRLPSRHPCRLWREQICEASLCDFHYSLFSTIPIPDGEQGIHVFCTIFYVIIGNYFLFLFFSAIGCGRCNFSAEVSMTHKSRRRSRIRSYERPLETRRSRGFIGP